MIFNLVSKSNKSGISKSNTAPLLPDTIVLIGIPKNIPKSKTQQTFVGLEDVFNTSLA